MTESTAGPTDGSPTGRPAGARRTFAPVVLLGLAAGALAAVAGNRPWVVEQGSDTTDPLNTVAEAGEMPLAAALSLVVLACWGVLLVTRGVVRRVVAVLALLAALGLVVCVVVGWRTLPDQVIEALAEQSGTGDAFSVETDAWFWAAAAGAVLSVVATALAVRWVGHWPEMGTRYDAPGAGGGIGTGGRTDGGAATAGEDQSSIDMWKSMDEGRDPTA